MTDRIPEPTSLGAHHSVSLGEAIMQRSDNAASTRRTVMGFFVPEWQRKLTWTFPQKIALIESLWKGIPIGTYSINVVLDDMDHDLSDMLIDGQQRMAAIESYMGDRFAVYGFYYSELNREELRRFRRASFPRYETNTTDEKYLRDYYNLMNFGGTAHTSDQKA